LLTTCESVCYYENDEVLFVSCINGNPVEKDLNGFVAKVSLTGEIILLKWIQELNAPKGMGIFQDKLYITDIDRIVEVNITENKIINEFQIEDAGFLNDITIDPQGSVYISDMSTGIIHRMINGKTETWIQSELLINPNGLFYENGDILAGTKNGIFTIRISDKKIWHLVKNTGSIDGLEAHDEGDYFISDWVGKVQLVSPEKENVILINTGGQNINAADIKYIPGQKLLLVPTFHNNSVAAYQIMDQ
jgi:hypothetical protein